MLNVWAWINDTTPYLFLAHGETEKRLKQERNVLEEQLAVGRDVRHLTSHDQPHLVTQVHEHGGLRGRGGAASGGKEIQLSTFEQDYTYLLEPWLGEHPKYQSVLSTNE